jgi:chromosome segregation ATPase
MAFRLAKDILHFLRDIATPTSLKRLQREGVNSVTVIDMDQIEDLIHRCVDRALRGANVDPARVQSLGQDAREEFLRLVTERDTLRAAHDSLAREKEGLEENLAKLKSAISQTGSVLDSERARDQAARADESRRHEVVQEELKAALGTWIENLPESRREAVGGLVEDLVARVSTLTENRIARETGRIREEEAVARRERIETLERRIDKLNSALSDAEGMVDRLRSNGLAEDDGVASIYRQVQGLSDNEPGFKRKKGLLEEIFKLNLELKDLVGQGGPQAKS